MRFVLIICLFIVVVVVVCERDVKYFGYERHVLENGEHEVNIHNPFLDNVVVQRNVANIPETNNEHHVERREIFGEDDRDEVSREHVPTEDKLAEVSTVSIVPCVL